MICEKCGAAYVSEHCPNCENASTEEPPRKKRMGLRELKKASIVLLVLLLAAAGLAAGSSILKTSGQRAKEKAETAMLQYVNDQITSQMQALYPELSREDVLVLYSVVDETESSVQGDSFWVKKMSSAEAELHVAKAMSFMRTYMNAAKTSGVTDMAVITGAIREQHKINKAIEAAEREAKAAADEAKAKAEDEQAKIRAEEAKAKADEAKAEAEKAKAFFGGLGAALEAAQSLADAGG